MELALLVLFVTAAVAVSVALLIMAGESPPWQWRWVSRAGSRSPRGAAAVFVAPGIAFNRFGYEVTDLGLYVVSGILWRRWQVVPHARVQTVDTRSGPLQRLFGVVSVAVTTASAEGGTEVPGLDPRVADTLVTELARRAGIEEGT